MCLFITFVHYLCSWRIVMKRIIMEIVNKMTKRQWGLYFIFSMCKLEVLIYFYFQSLFESYLTWVQITTNWLFGCRRRCHVICGKSKLSRGGGDVSPKHESLAFVTVDNQQVIINNTVFNNVLYKTFTFSFSVNLLMSFINVILWFKRCRCLLLVVIILSCHRD